MVGVSIPPPGTAGHTKVRCSREGFVFQLYLFYHRNLKIFMLPELVPRKRDDKDEVELDTTALLLPLCKGRMGGAMAKGLVGLRPYEEECSDINELERLEGKLRAQEKRLHTRSVATQRPPQALRNPSPRCIPALPSAQQLAEAEATQALFRKENSIFLERHRLQDNQYQTHQNRLAEGQRRKEDLARRHLQKIEQNEADLAERKRRRLLINPICPLDTPGGIEDQTKAEQQLEEVEKRIEQLMLRSIRMHNDPLLGAHLMECGGNMRCSQPPTPSRQDGLGSGECGGGWSSHSDIVSYQKAPSTLMFAEMLSSFASPVYHPFVSVLPKAATKWPETLSPLLYPFPRRSVVPMSGGRRSWPAMKLNAVKTVGAVVLFGGGGEGEGSPLGMEYPAPIVVRGVVWRSAAHFFHAMKFSGMRIAQEEVATSSDPAGCAQTQRRPQRADWVTVRNGVMYEALLAKLNQHPHIAAFLRSTAPARLLCADPDVYWGIDKGGRGCNKLGTILTEMRTALLNPE